MRPVGVAVPNCRYFRDDCVDAVGDDENPREFFDGLAGPDRNDGKSDGVVNEPTAEYVLPLVAVVH